MTEMWPRSSVRVLTDATGGGGPDSIGAARERWASSNASPARNFKGKVSGVVLNSLCPRSQNSVSGTERYFRATSVYDSRTLPALRSVAMTCDIGHPSWITFLASPPTIRERNYWSVMKANSEMSRSLLQHPMSRNMASGRLFPSSRTRGYAGVLEALSIVNLNPRMQGYGKT